MRHQLGLKQKQTVSQHLVQSAQVLQMNAAELEAYLQQQVLENPVIDLDEAPVSADAGERRGARDWQRGTDLQNRAYYRVEAREEAWQGPRNAEENLAEYLTLQMDLTRSDPRERRITAHLIQSLDDSGYYTDDPEETARLLDVTPEEVLSCLARIQQMDPAGVGARDLRECLLLQLRRDPGHTSVEEAVISDYLPDVARNRLQQIARQLKCPLEAVLDAVERIRAMNPRPGSAFGGGELPVYVRPDAVVERDEDGLSVRLDERAAAGVILNADYLKMLDSATDPELCTYLREKVERARALAADVARRGTTLQQVVHALAVRQEPFFRLGKGHRCPMTLADLAADTGLHPSTISRAMRGKYLQCSWGLFPMNYFLTAAAAAPGPGGDTVTQERVQELIRQAVDGEDKSDPLSDEAICRKLAAFGIPVARRTVSKYRQMMGLPSRSGRRRYQ